MDIKKIKNFLYYNWLKIAIFVFAAVFCVVTLMQCSQRSETDLGIMYVGKAVASKNLPLLAEEIKKSCYLADADGDGKISLNTKTITIGENKQEMIVQQVPEQIQVEIISGENLLYILDKSILISYSVDQSFADITDLALKYNIPRDNCLTYENGAVYAISAEGTKILEDFGVESKGMYFALRNYLEKDKNNPLNINAKKSFEFILERNK